MCALYLIRFTYKILLSEDTTVNKKYLFSMSLQTLKELNCFSMLFAALLPEMGIF